MSPHVLLWRWLQHTLLWLTWWTRRKKWKRNISTAKRKILPQGLRRFAQILGHFVQMREASFPGDLFAEQRTRCLKVVCTTCIQIQQRIRVALLIVFFSWVEIWNQPWVALYAGNSRFCADGSWVERLKFGVNGFSCLPLPCLELFATACSPAAFWILLSLELNAADLGIDSWLGTPKVKQFIKLWKMCLIVDRWNTGHGMSTTDDPSVTGASILQKSPRKTIIRADWFQNEAVVENNCLLRIEMKEITPLKTILLCRSWVLGYPFLRLLEPSLLHTPCKRGQVGHGGTLHPLRSFLDISQPYLYVQYSCNINILPARTLHKMPWLPRFLCRPSGSKALSWQRLRSPCAGFQAQTQRIPTYEFDWLSSHTWKYGIGRIGCRFSTYLAKESK